MAQSTALAAINPQDVAALDKIAGDAQLVFSGSGSNFADAFQVAAAMNALKQAITSEMMQHVMLLQNTSLGFKTDKDPKQINRKTGQPNIPYPEETVKSCLIEAVLRGLRPVGNQFNIIAAQCYTTKEGYTALLKKVKGLTDLKIALGVPQAKSGGVIISCKASWKLGGKDDTLEADIPVKADEYSGADQLLGKCERKFKKRIYGQITGVETEDGDVSEVDDSHMLAAGEAKPADTADPWKGNKGGDDIDMSPAPQKVETPEIPVTVLPPETPKPAPETNGKAPRKTRVPAKETVAPPQVNTPQAPPEPKIQEPKKEEPPQKPEQEPALKPGPMDNVTKPKQFPLTQEQEEILTELETGLVLHHESIKRLEVWLKKNGYWPEAIKDMRQYISSFQKRCSGFLGKLKELSETVRKDLGDPAESDQDQLL